jgi:hypothetical protein
MDDLGPAGCSPARPHELIHVIFAFIGTPRLQSRGVYNFILAPSLISQGVVGMSHPSLFQTFHAIQSFSFRFTRSSMFIHAKEYQVRLFYPALIARRSAGLEANSDHNK